MAREILVTDIMEWSNREPIHMDNFSEDGSDFAPVFDWLACMKIKIAITTCPGSYFRSPKFNHELNIRGFSPKKFASHGLSFADTIEHIQRFIDAGLQGLIPIYDHTDQYQISEFNYLLEQLRGGGSGRLYVGALRLRE